MTAWSEPWPRPAQGCHCCPGIWPRPLEPSPPCAASGRVWPLRGAVWRERWGARGGCWGHFGRDSWPSSRAVAPVPLELRVALTLLLTGAGAEALRPRSISPGTCSPLCLQWCEAMAPGAGIAAHFLTPAFILRWLPMAVRSALQSRLRQPR